MRIPAIFHGTAKNVKARVKSAARRVARGASIADALDVDHTVAMNEHPESHVWIDRAWAGIGGRPHFVLCVLGEILFSSGVLAPPERAEQVHREALQLLSKTLWGTAAVNASQCYAWACGVRVGSLDREAARILVTCTCAHWDELLAMGPRFFCGGYEAVSFERTLPLVSHVLANCGIDPRVPSSTGMPRLRRDLPAIVRENDVLARIADDDAFWKDVVSGALRIGPRT